jgi:hypothetical protein
MHKILSKCQPSLRLIASHGKLWSGGQRKWIMSKDLEQRSEFINTPNNTARSINYEKRIMSDSNQRNTVDHHSDHEEAWSVIDELSNKESLKKKKQQNKMFQIKRLQNLKQFLLKNENKFKTDIGKKALGKQKTSSTTSSILPGTSFLCQQGSSSNHLQTPSRGISTSPITIMAKQSSTAYMSDRSQDALSQFAQVRSWTPTSLGKSVWAGQVPTALGQH